jgi:hypothetical protein
MPKQWKPFPGGNLQVYGKAIGPPGGPNKGDSSHQAAPDTRFALSGSSFLAQLTSTFALFLASKEIKCCFTFFLLNSPIIWWNLEQESFENAIFVNNKRDLLWSPLLL